MTLLTGDAVDVMLSLGSISATFESVVTDPPYGLGAWDWIKNKADMADWYEAWAAAALLLVPPGAHMLMFGGTKHHHRAFVAVEDAGWEFRDTLCWLYGSGMPKNRYNLKPAWEPIGLFRRPGPYQELDIDGCRIPTTENLSGGAYAKDGSPRTGMIAEHAWGKDPMRNGGAGEYQQPTGRVPANVCVDEEAAQRLDEQTAHLKKGGRLSGEEPSAKSTDTVGYGKINREQPWEPYGDSGGASRFFYCAKASPGERNAGLEDKNGHPTVKPLALMQWLVRLVTPLGGHILDPFVGSGTTGCAAALEGFGFTGIDDDPGTVAIAGARIAHWAGVDG